MVKAHEFLQAALIIEALAETDLHMIDAYITICVHAGIAASDVICCSRLGKHAVGERHVEAIALLEQVDTTMAKHLDVLLKQKTRSGYSSTLSNAASKKQASRAAKALVDFAASLT